MADTPTLKELVGFDPTCHLDSNYQHLLYVFEGYRDYMVDRCRDGEPYSPGGARDISWRHGVKLAKKDVRESNKRKRIRAKKRL